MTRQISGDLVNLKPISNDDAVNLHVVLSNPAVMDEIFSISQNLRDTKRWIKRTLALTPDWSACWSIIPSGGNTIIGFIMYYGRNAGNSYCSIAYGIIPSEQRKGYGSSSIYLLLNHIFHDLCINRVEAEIKINNQASEGILQRVGFVCESQRMRQRLMFGGTAEDSKMYALLKEDFSWDKIDVRG
jgi:[ribosomal protein S5]-alanine N-acetyltransferase